MSCADACIGDTFDSEGPTLHREEVRRSRKSRACCECGQAIAAGDRYEYVRGLWDGYWSTYRTCLLCVEIRHALSCGYWSYGEVWGDIAETVFEAMDRSGPWDCLAKIPSEAARAKLRAAWEEHRKDSQ